jgi:N-glycosylase/DNA lyase
MSETPEGLNAQNSFSICEERGIRMKIQLNSSHPFNLDATLRCGQVFRWDKRDDWWYSAVKENALKIRQVGDLLEFEGANTEFVKGYFGLDDDLPKILMQISEDEHIQAAIKAFMGLRILRQEPWECLISYICATYKNISAIERMLSHLSRKFGGKIHNDSYDFYTFPTPEKLARATTKELAECGLGYRAEYVSETAEMVFEKGLKFERLTEMPYEEAREELLNFSGVGLKVADCVLLFSLGKLEAFPVDVWIKRAILRYYANHFPRKFIEKIAGKKSPTRSEYEQMSLFGRRYFGKYAGYAQEYLYHYMRSQANKLSDCTTAENV